MTFLFFCVILKNRTKIFEYEENEDILINIPGKTNKWLAKDKLYNASFSDTSMTEI